MSLTKNILEGLICIKIFLRVVLFTSLFSLLAISCAFASGSDIAVFLNGDKVDFTDQKPYIDNNGRTLVPIRFISEALGANVQWDNGQQTVTITKDQNVALLTINKNTIIVNGEEKVVDTEPVITDQGRTMVPVRFISEALGEPIGWDKDTCSVFIGEGAEIFNNSTDTLGDWKGFYPLPDYEKNESIYQSDISFGNGHFILTTSHNRLFTSNDGIDWKYIKTMDKDFTNDLHYVNGKFVSSMLSYNEVIWTSEDGIEWSKNRPNVSGEYSFSNLGKRNITDYAYGNGKYIGVGQVEWKDPITLTSGQPYSVSRIAPLIYVSTDCENWKVINLENLVEINPNKDFDEGLEKIVFENGFFLALSDNDDSSSIYKSWDGENWYKVPLGCWFRDIAYGNGVFIAIGQINWVAEYVWKSEDGENWSPTLICDFKTTSKEDYVRYNTIEYGGGVFALMGMGGGLMTSNDGEQWTRQEYGTNNWLEDMVYGNRTFLSIEAKGLSFSNNNINYDNSREMMFMAKFK